MTDKRATEIMDGRGRMPTYAEIKELVSEQQNLSASKMKEYQNNNKELYQYWLGQYFAYEFVLNLWDERRRKAK